MSAVRHKQRAKQIIVEIIRQAGGRFQNKTNLFKAFWKSHLEYTARHSAYLSGWPIVKMPRGPGIENFDTLIGELLTESVIHVKQVAAGPFEAFAFELRDNDAYPMNDQETDAIRSGVAWALKRSSGQASNDSHESAWEQCEVGKEMNIYTDIIDEPQDPQAAEVVKSLWK